MLTRLIIRNYAIIPALDIAFRPGLTIITGETGAGKSILLGALGLALGKRAETRVLPDDAEKCVVEAHFQLEDDALRHVFDQEALDYDTHLICRREIGSGGRSRSFINDTPVSLKLLQEITAQLLELHHQHDNLALQAKEYQVRVLDTFSGSAKDMVTYAGLFSEWNMLKSTLEKTREADSASARKKEFLRFQLNELAQAKLTPGEIADLEATQNTLEHAESIEQVLTQVRGTLQAGPHAVLNQLAALSRQVAAVADFFSPLTEIRKRIESVRLELEDLAIEAERMEGPGGHDPAKLNRTQSRLNQLYTLIKKYQCQDEAQLIALHTALESELASLASAGETIAGLEKKLEEVYRKLLEAGEKLSARRKAGAKKLVPKVDALLHELGMPNARFDVRLEAVSAPTASGMDEVQFLFSANKGMSLQPLQSVASGGELSRLSLAMKSIYAGEAHLPSIIFDEIDTGISGEVAWRMGQLILTMSKGHQILMITHSPQIAAHADHQYHVSKITSGKKDISDIRQLSPDQRVQEIAKMLSGDPPSKAAVSNAESLISSVSKK